MNVSKLFIIVLFTIVLSACTENTAENPAPAVGNPEAQNQQTAPVVGNSDVQNQQTTQTVNNPEVEKQQTGALGGQYAGTIKMGKNFKFTLSEDGRQVTDISADVLEYCGGSTSSSWTTIYLAGPFDVKDDGTVFAEGKEQDDALTLTYTFTAAFDSQGNVTGTVNQATVVVGSVCDTYTLDWEAKKQ